MRVPTLRLALSLPVFGLTLVLLFAAAYAQAADRHIDGFVGGKSGTAAGSFFGAVGGVAVYEGTDNDPTTDKVFVVDRSSERIQRFDRAGRFELTWGKDVVVGGGAGAEICTVPADCHAGAEGTGRGEFFNPVGLAVDQENGWVYVYGEGEGNAGEAVHVDKFDLDGNFLLRFGKGVNQTSGGNVCPRPGFPADLCKAGAGGSGAGELGDKFTGVANSHLAVSPAAPHDVFVGDSVNHRVMQFHSDGSFARAWGYDVAPGGVPAFETCTAISGCQAGSLVAPGDANGQFGNRGLEFIAVDSDGIVYANDTKHPARITRFDSDEFAAPGAGLLSPITATDGIPAGPLLAGGTDGIAADPNTNHLYVVRVPAGGDAVIQETDSAGTTIFFSSPPPGDTGLLGSLSGSSLALQASTGNLYLTAQGSTSSNFPACGNTSGSGICSGYFTLDSDGFNPQSMIVGPPADVTATSVTLSGSVTPNGFATYRFQYSKDGVEWADASADRPIASLATEPVSEPISGLEPNSAYRARLISKKIYGAAASLELTSTEGLFTTAAVPPDVETLSTSQRTATTARIFGRVNPNNLPTTFYFEYGPTGSYGSKVPIPDGNAGDDFGDRILSAEIAGLEPGTTYHYRIVATNGEEVTPGDELVEGDDVTFTTRDLATSPPARAAEMVTPPFKIVRAAIRRGAPAGDNPNPGVPSADGEVVAWSTDIFPLTDEAATGADGDTRIIRRTPDGWVWQTRNTLRSKFKIDGEFSDSFVPSVVKQDPIASSGDFETLAWYVENGELIKSDGSAPGASSDLVHNPFYTRRDGTGIEGFTPWLENSLTQSRQPSGDKDRALINDAGTAMVRWGRYIGLADDPETPGDEDPTDDTPEVTGDSIYLQHAPDPDDMPVASKDLVNECTGSGADATLIPLRIGGGGPTDTIGTQACEQGSLPSRSGAAVGDLDGWTTAMSNDGRRVFFTTGGQLYVRQYDQSGENPVVRWISRAQGVGTQRIGELAFSSFQGASRDGRFVYFKTKSPLLPDDPNGGDSITNGEASGDSWDLYHYTLPESLDTDPATGTLTRITGGPSGSADPGTTSSALSLHYLSDDGRRAYFLTVAPIAGADATAPSGGATLPGGAVNGDDTTRNLYLFDETETGPDRYRFIAKLPHSPGEDLGLYEGPTNDCASKSTGQLGVGHVAGTSLVRRANCFRGTTDGTHIIFFTFGRLTADDDDNAGDIYIYDSTKDELTRVSAPPPGAVPYGNSATELRHADLGQNLSSGGWYAFGGAGHLDSAGGWGRGRYYNMAKDADGAVSVFFQSKSELVPEDQNGDHMDVYQWREGELSLISPASPGHYSFYSGNSIDGQDVFIFTTERIDPREIDDFDYDIYDMRIGGGFPYTPPPETCDVLAFKCEGAATPAPSTPTAPTVGFAGRGNVKAPGKCRKGQARRKGRCVPAGAKGRARHKAGSKRKGDSK